MKSVRTEEVPALYLPDDNFISTPLVVFGGYALFQIFLYVICGFGSILTNGEE